MKQFNVGDKIIFLDNDGKFKEGIIEDLIATFKIRDSNEMCSFVCSNNVFKNKQEVIDSLGLNIIK